jgi:hypothetical protein
MICGVLYSSGCHSDNGPGVALVRHRTLGRRLRADLAKSPAASRCATRYNYTHTLKKACEKALLCPLSTLAV